MASGENFETQDLALLASDHGGILVPQRATGHGEGARGDGLDSPSAAEVNISHSTGLRLPDFVRDWEAVTQSSLSSSPPRACHGCVRGDANGDDADLGSDPVGSVARPDPFCDLTPLFQHLWRREEFPRARVNFCGGWCRVSAKSIDPALRAATLIEELP